MSRVEGNLHFDDQSQQIVFFLRRGIFDEK